jgi:hypothetical protein
MQERKRPNLHIIQVIVCFGAGPALLHVGHLVLLLSAGRSVSVRRHGHGLSAGVRGLEEFSQAAFTLLEGLL